MSRRKALPILLLLLSGPACAAGAAPQITFVQNPPATRNQNQESLPPEKKKSLSGIGPDEVFREQNEEPQAARRPENRSRSSAKPAATPTPSPAAAQSPTPTPTISQPQETPTALPAAAPIITSTPSPPPPSPNGNGWLLPGLGVLSMLVFAALIFVVGRLRQLLRES